MVDISDVRKKQWITKKVLPLTPVEKLFLLIIETWRYNNFVTSLLVVRVKCATNSY